MAARLLQIVVFPYRGCSFTAVATPAMATVAGYGHTALFVAHKKAHKTVDLG